MTAINIDDSLYNQAFPILENHGLTAAQAVRLFFNQIVKTKTIPRAEVLEIQNVKKDEQNQIGNIDSTVKKTDELLFQVTGIRPLPDSKYLVTDDMVNQIREQEGI